MDFKYRANKKSGQICVCVDFRDLNNVYPKDDFPLPITTEIMVDTTTGHERLTFIDGSFAYNQIQMALANEKTTFWFSKRDILL